MKELVPKEEFTMFLLNLTDDEYVEFAQASGLPVGPMEELARLAEETLDALETSDGLDAAYAAFQVGYAMAFAEGQGKSVDRMMQGKIEKGLVYSDEFKQEAVARAKELLNQSPRPKLASIYKKVKRDLGGRLSYKKLMEWLKEARD